MMKHEILYLEIDDEITSVAEKVRSAESHEVVLVVPKNAVLLQSIVNLKLLGKTASKVHKRLAVVTADKSARNIVFRAGLPLMARVSDPFPEKAPQPVMPASTSGDEISLPKEGEEQTDAPRKENIGDKEIEVKTYKSDAPTDAESEEPEDEQRAPAEPSRALNKMPTHIPLIRKTQASDDKLEKIRALQSRRTSNKSRLPKSLVTIILAFVGLALVVTIGVLYFVLPRATVVLSPKTEPASAKVNVTVVTEGANATLFELNGKFIEATKQESKNFPASGKKDFGKKASGSVTFTNSYSSAPQVFAVGTKLQTTNGLTYLLSSTVTIPGATVSGGSTVPGTATVTAAADKTGEGSNIGSKDLVIVGLSTDKKEKITAATTGFSGGTEDIKKVVTQEDVDAAKKTFEEQVKSDARSELKKKIDSGSLLINGASAVEITESKSSITPGDAADAFDLSVTIHASGLTFDESALKQLAATQLATKLSGQKNILATDEGTFTYEAASLDLAAKRMVVGTTVNKTVVPALDLDAFKPKLQGKNEAEVRDYFAPLSEISSVRVVFWPFYVTRVPGSDSRITVELDTK